jgi:hypothetical protein
MNKFDNIVLYQLCDFLYDAHNNSSKGSRISYENFTTLCNSLSEKLIHGVTKFNKGERIILNITMDRLSKFFGLTDDEAAIYMYNFLFNKYWLNVHGSISLVNSAFTLSKNI